MLTVSVYQGYVISSGDSPCYSKGIPDPNEMENYSIERIG